MEISKEQNRYLIYLLAEKDSTLKERKQYFTDICSSYDEMSKHCDDIQKERILIDKIFKILY